VKMDESPLYDAPMEVLLRHTSGKGLDGDEYDRTLEALTPTPKREIPWVHNNERRT
jgi:hypothetical protein